MRRRTFVEGIAVLAAAWPLAAQAQQLTRMPRIGVLTVALISSPIDSAFRQGLRDLGYVEGQNLI
jgi:putative ABC transport system substrate-binding protein